MQHHTTNKTIKTGHYLYCNCDDCNHQRIAYLNNRRANDMSLAEEDRKPLACPCSACTSRQAVSK